MRRALVLLAALALAGAGEAQQRPGPTPLYQGVAPGGLAAQAGDIRLDRKVKAELGEDAPPRSKEPYLKGGKMRPSPALRGNAAPKKRTAAAPAAKQKGKPKPKPTPKPVSAAGRASASSAS